MDKLLTVLLEVAGPRRSTVSASPLIVPQVTRKGRERHRRFSCSFLPSVPVSRAGRRIKNLAVRSMSAFRGVEACPTPLPVNCSRLNMSSYFRKHR